MTATLQEPTSKQNSDRQETHARQSRLLLTTTAPGYYLTANSFSFLGCQATFDACKLACDPLADLIAQVCEGCLVIQQAREVWRQGPADTVLWENILGQGVVDCSGGC